MSDVTVQDEPENKVAEPASPAPAPTPTAPPKAPALSGDVPFNEHITVYAANRLPQFDKGPVKAYVARGTDKAPPNLFALICEEHLTPRIAKAGSYGSIINPAMTSLVASGTLHWPSANKEKYCFIYENRLGNPVMKDDLRGGMGIKPELALNSIVRPLIGVLADMRDKDIVHGNIRPANLFDGGSRTIERVILGECLSLPASYYQPALYETIDRAMTSPIGRGQGTINDDVYSFGVTLAVLLRHFDPMEHLSEEEIIVKKMEEGSYVALLGKDRFSGAILELLRGVLQDEESQRWTLDDMLVWLDGRRLSPKQPVRKSKANRPLSFNGEKYIRPELLAKDINKNVNEARQLVENGEMEQWLTRALENKIIMARYEKGLKQAEDEGKAAGYTERLATRVSIALHPEGPMRFRSVNVMPEGMGAALTEAFIMKRDLQTYIDFIMNYFITQWVDAQDGVVADMSALVGRFDSARAYLRQKGLGGGLERCIYAFNQEVHCLSEKLQKFWVRTPEEMMYAFEKMSKMPNRPAMFFDRHSAAFISAKERKNIDPYLHDMNAPESYKRIMAEMKTLATIQKKSQMEKFPGIAAWMVDNLDPLYERFHDRELRASLKKQAERLIDIGDLAKILMLFDNPETYQEDNLNFRKSMRSYHEMEEEVFKTEQELRDEATFGQATGRQVAAVVSGILAAIIVLSVGFFGIGGL